MPLLSVAMMVRNEERHLERCLKSLALLHPEIIILDTGSTDGTIEIAKRFTKNVYHQPWQNDFSLHRNESFSYATGDWILQIDADEELIWANPEAGPAEFAKFLRTIAPSDADAVFIPLRDWRESIDKYAGEIDIPRVFRHGSTVYKRRVHNDPCFKGRATVFRGFYLKHYGYDLTEAEKKAKAERSIPLLLESLKDDPDDHECLFYLMNAYEAWMGDSEKAVEYGLEYIDRQEKIDDSFNQTVYHSLAGIFIRDKNYSDARDMINQGLAKWRENVDLWYDTLRIAIAEKNPLSIAQASQNYVHSVRRFSEAGRKTKAGCFFYHLDPDSIANGLYYLMISYMENGAVELANLKNVLKIAGAETRQTIETILKRDLELLKIRDLSTV